MATFECKVYKLTIEEHPNADALELARVGDYVSIVRKGQFQTGDLGVYIPEAAIVPDWLLKEIGLEGKLAGKDKNRVKAMKLRGILSQGLIYPVLSSSVNGEMRHVVLGESGVDQESTSMNDCIDVEKGTDVTEFLGITKWEPPIPSSMSGEVFNAFGKTLKYDIENIKRYPDVLEEGEDIMLTEKIHGTWCCIAYHPELDHPLVTSKGLSEKGLAFKFNEANERNLYVQICNKVSKECSIDDLIKNLPSMVGESDDTPVYLLGEVYGKGVQDLAYADDVDKHFRVFDIYVGEPERGGYMNPRVVRRVCEVIGIDMVPWVYMGPYSKDIVEDFTNGKELVSGKELHMREGVVIRPLDERRHDELGRVILKSVSEAYLLRKGGTEYN